MGKKKKKNSKKNINAKAAAESRNSAYKEKVRAGFFAVIIMGVSIVACVVATVYYLNNN